MTAPEDGRKTVNEMMDKEEKVLEEIRRQAFIRADQRRRETVLMRETCYTFDVLQELTGLPRRELETIAADVKACCHQEDREFFSVKHQLLMVFSGLVLIGSFAWVFTRLIF